VPRAGLTAWQALFDHGKLAQGQTAIIHGAGGAVGSTAVQLARWAGAHVIGIGRSHSRELVLELDRGRPGWLVRARESTSPPGTSVTSSSTSPDDRTAITPRNGVYRDKIHTI
jgi:NAD(P)-dependent dehydrogenase (short-subunit alcohol dehydrogenase family)